MKSQSFRPCPMCKVVRSATGYASCKRDPACRKFDPSLIEITGEKSLASLIDKGRTVALGHVTATEFATTTPPPADEQAFLAWLKHAHSLVFQSGVPSIAGRFRVGRERIFFGGERQHQREGVAAPMIERELINLHHRLQVRSADGMRLPRIMAHFLEEFFLVHPFRDGNGRVARLFVSALATQHGFVFQPVTGSRGRRRYIKALEYAHNRCDPRERRRLVRNPVLPLEQWIERGLVRPNTDF